VAEYMNYVPAFSPEPMGFRHTDEAVFLEVPRIGVAPHSDHLVVIEFEGKRVAVDPWKLGRAMDLAINAQRGKRHG
jgi:hypothetical protein